MQSSSFRLKTRGAVAGAHRPDFFVTFPLRHRIQKYLQNPEPWSYNWLPRCSTKMMGAFKNILLKQ
jgi:hypothetical protein